MENCPFFVQNLNPSLYVTQIQKLLKVNQQSLTFRSFNEESSSFESSVDDLSTDLVTTDEDKDEDKKVNKQCPKKYIFISEGPQEDKQEFLENHCDYTDNSDIKEMEYHQMAHDFFSSHSEQANNVNENEGTTDAKRGLVSLFESLPSNYPVKSVISNGKEIYVSFFIQYEPVQQLVYFSDDENVISIESHLYRWDYFCE